MVLDKNSIMKMGRSSIETVRLNSTSIYFSKGAIELIGSGKKVLFDVDRERALLKVDNENGLEIKFNQSNYVIHSIPLVRAIESEINFGHPKFLLKKTEDDNTFSLTIING